MLKDKVWSCINNWKNIFLFQAGKEVLLKLVVQVIPTYTMGMFKLFQRTCIKMVSLMFKFWQGHMQKESGIHQRKWRFLGENKSQRDLDFRDFQAFNKALLAKQLWHLIESPNSLTTQILKSIYFPTTGVLDVKLHNNPSLIWRSFHSSMDLIKEGLLWHIRDGHSVHIWGNNWLPTPLQFKVQSCIHILDSKAKVANLLNLKTKTWNHHLISQVFSSEEVATILNIPLSMSGATDKLTWWPTKDGCFSVKFAYAL